MTHKAASKTTIDCESCALFDTCKKQIERDLVKRIERVIKQCFQQFDANSEPTDIDEDAVEKVYMISESRWRQLKKGLLNKYT